MDTTPMHQKIREHWWRGVALWYNDQDYLQAMTVWEEALNELPWPSMHGNESVVHRLLSMFTDLGNNSQHLTSFLAVAPLLLFLAGCYLDGGSFDQARTSLCRCLFILETEKTNEPLVEDNQSYLYVQAIHECLSLFQEDPTVRMPMQDARALVSHAIDRCRRSVPWTNEWQRPGFFYPISNQIAVYDRSNHPPWCQVLEEKWTDIRDDFERLLRGGRVQNQQPSVASWPAVGSGSHRGGAGAHDGSVVATGGDWREIVLFGSGERPDLAPRTCRLLEQICPDVISLARAGGGEVLFSVLGPQTHIKAHCGGTNLRLTAHLGLSIPMNDAANCCSIRVADTRLTWQEGKVIVFDDSFEHTVDNGTDRLRGVLLLRFWHPNLPCSERDAALQSALDAKAADQLRRYNPPIPTEHCALKKRTMEQSRCPSCWGQGFESIRLDEHSHVFACRCGHRIQDI